MGGPKPFCRLGPGFFLSTQTPPKTSKWQNQKPKNPASSPVAPSYGQNSCFVGWVPNQQKRCPTDEMAPSRPPKRPYPGPQGHMRPQTGFTGPHAITFKRWVFRPERSPRPGKSTVLGPESGRKIYLSPPASQKPVNRQLPEKFANTTQRRQSKKVAQHKRGSDEPNSSASYGQKKQL